MNARSTSAGRAVAVIIATLLGITSFFVIIGVFGLPASIAALVLFVVLSILIFRRPQVGETSS